jgi:class 3 adenylate cyclase
VPLLLTALLTLLFGCVPTFPAAPEPVNGTVDLRDWDPESGPVRLDGDWAFHWMELQSPGSAAGTPEWVAVPGPWKTEERANPGYGTYRLKILPPADSPDLALRIGSLGGAGRAWVNEVELPGMGVVSADAEALREDVRTVGARFAPMEESELVIQVSNQRHRSSGIRRSVLLGTADQMDELTQRLLATDVFVVSTLMAMGLSFLFIFMSRRRESTMLWFGLTCAALSLRHSLTGGAEIFLHFGPELAWPIRLRLEYITTALGVIFGYMVSIKLMVADLNRPIHKVPIVLAGLAALTSLLIPFSLYHWAFQLLLIAQTIGIMGAAAEVLLGMSRGKKMYGGLLLVGLLVFVAGMAVDQISARTGRSFLAGDVTAPAFMVMVVIQGVTVALSFTKALRRGEALHESSLRYVPKEMLGLLQREDIIQAKRGDQAQLEMEILFVDIRGYTTIAEAMPSSALFPTLNRYLSYVVPPISSGGGFVSQYLGDGILALFHEGADKAVMAGVEMRNAVDAFNAASPDVPDFVLGMGMSSGPVTLGIIGSTERLDSNIVGDAPNQASRVEGMTKRYGAPFMIDERTYARLQHPERFTIRELDRVISKGKSVAIRIYEVLDALPEESRALRLAALPSFEEALAAYRDGDLDHARRAFESALSVDPDDLSCQLYLERISARTQALPLDWDGTHALDWK